MNRAQKRKLKKQTKENQILTEQISLFEKLPTSCNVCEKLFDKANKKMVSSWRVVTREKEQIIRLFCPECHNLATKAVENVG